MLIFQVTSLISDPALVTRIEQVYSAAHIRLGAASSWLVADGAVTTEEVSKKLGLLPGTPHQVIVVRVDSYYGLAPPTYWEWINVKRQDS